MLPSLRFKTNGFPIRNHKQTYSRLYSTHHRLKRSSLFVPVKKDVPADTVIPSHTLMIQYGLLSKSSAGIYTLLPFALRSTQKIINIIDREMESIGGQKVAMPTLVSSNLWKESGRWDSAGEELIKLKDRKGSQFCLGPTHEEVVTDIVRNNVNSFRQFPLKIYQIGNKFRDEIRPRFGLMRAREFIMKDMYSFDRTKEDSYASYQLVKEAYNRIFSSMKTPFSIADADSGKIGGDKSQEFHIISDHGEDLILACECSKYISNVEKAIGKIDSPHLEELTRLASNWKSVKDVREGLKSFGDDIVSESFVIQKGEDEFGAIALVRKGRSANAFKIKSLEGADDFYESDLSKWETDNFSIYLDESLGVSKGESNNSSSLNLLFDSLEQKKFGRVQIGDFRMAKAGDSCPSLNQCDCKHGSKLSERRGIEVGHIFYLGKKYSEPLKAKFTG
eukprot:TRINITY_DN2308_c0_g1_i3.p1 TRINITY_DN2308_c0_g1~~TRINITY_DN2308_c0_g1_i3.p1  ORF type:complete len:448 (-),score=168.85 TRINITY_DN2308_c0_g1_i3:152-1495(-)